MGKDNRLVNIYLRIHNKQVLTFDDLRYLAQYAPDCFEKTCKNVVYNLPEAKPILEPSPAPPQNNELNPPPFDQQNITNILQNLKRLESDNFPIQNIDTDEVKNLLGNLYMELLFPHNDDNTFFNVANSEGTSLFDRKI